MIPTGKIFFLFWKRFAFCLGCTFASIANQYAAGGLHVFGVLVLLVVVEGGDDARVFGLDRLGVLVFFVILEWQEGGGS